MAWVPAVRFVSRRPLGVAVMACGRRADRRGRGGGHSWGPCRHVGPPPRVSHLEGRTALARCDTLRTLTRPVVGGNPPGGWCGSRPVLRILLGDRRLRRYQGGRAGRQDRRVQDSASRGYRDRRRRRPSGGIPAATRRRTKPLRGALRCRCCPTWRPRRGGAHRRCLRHGRRGR